MAKNSSTIYKPRVLAEQPADVKALSVNVHAEDTNNVTRRKFLEFHCIESLEIEASASELLFVFETLNPKTLRELRFSLPLFPKEKTEVNFEAKLLARLETFVNLEHLSLNIISADNLKNLSRLIEFQSRYERLDSKAVEFLASQKNLKSLYLCVTKYEGADLEPVKFLKQLQKMNLICSSASTEKKLLAELKRIGFLVPVIIEGTLMSIDAGWSQPAVLGVLPTGLFPNDAVEPKNNDLIEVYSNEGTVLFTGTIEELCPGGRKTAKVQRWFDAQLKAKVKIWKSVEGIEFDLSLIPN